MIAEGGTAYGQMETLARSRSRSFHEKHHCSELRVQA